MHGIADWTESGYSLFHVIAPEWLDRSAALSISIWLDNTLREPPEWKKTQDGQ